MPHVSSGGGDDLGSTDEVKVFKDEGDGEDEKRSSENLTEEKSSLIDLTESEVHKYLIYLLLPLSDTLLDMFLFCDELCLFLDYFYVSHFYVYYFNAYLN